MHIYLHVCVHVLLPGHPVSHSNFMARVHTYSSSESAWWNTLEFETNVIVSFFFFFFFFFSWPWGWKCFNMKYVKVRHCIWKSLKVEIAWKCFLWYLFSFDLSHHDQAVFQWQSLPLKGKYICKMYKSMLQLTRQKVLHFIKITFQSFMQMTN